MNRNVVLQWPWVRDEDRRLARRADRDIERRDPRFAPRVIPVGHLDPRRPDEIALPAGLPVRGTGAIETGDDQVVRHGQTEHPL